jgi:hypothetical protein
MCVEAEEKCRESISQAADSYAVEQRCEEEGLQQSGVDGSAVQC